MKISPYDKYTAESLISPVQNGSNESSRSLKITDIEQDNCLLTELLSVGETDDDGHEFGASSVSLSLKDCMEKSESHGTLQLSQSIDKWQASSCNSSIAGINVFMQSAHFQSSSSSIFNESRESVDPAKPQRRGSNEFLDMQSLGREVESLRSRTGNSTMTPLTNNDIKQKLKSMIDDAVGTAQELEMDLEDKAMIFCSPESPKRNAREELRRALSTRFSVDKRRKVERSCGRIMGDARGKIQGPRKPCRTSSQEKTDLNASLSGLDLLNNKDRVQGRGNLRRSNERVVTPVKCFHESVDFYDFPDDDSSVSSLSCFITDDDDDDDSIEGIETYLHIGNKASEVSPDSDSKSKPSVSLSGFHESKRLDRAVDASLPKPPCRRTSTKTPI